MINALIAYFAPILARGRENMKDPERGVETLEVVIITVVVIGLALLVGTFITGLVNDQIAKSPL